MGKWLILCCGNDFEVESVLKARYLRAEGTLEISPMRSVGNNAKSFAALQVRCMARIGGTPAECDAADWMVPTLRIGLISIVPLAQRAESALFYFRTESTLEISLWSNLRSDPRRFLIFLVDRIVR